MKKTTTLLFAIFCFVFINSTNAQFTEDFESGMPGNFTETINQGTTGWSDCGGNLSTQTCPIGGASSASFYVGSYDGDNATLTTPTIELSAGGNALTFTHSQLEWRGEWGKRESEVTVFHNTSL